LNVVSWVDLDPWGGETSGSNALRQPHRFTTYERDLNGGDEAMFRRYESKMPKFSQPDPYDGSYDLTDPQSFNRYSYTQNDPVNFTDPLGLDDLPKVGDVTIKDSFDSPESVITDLERGSTLPGGVITFRSLRDTGRTSTGPGGDNSQDDREKQRLERIKKWRAEELRKCLKNAERYKEFMTRLINDTMADDMTTGLVGSTITALAARLLKKAGLAGWLAGMGVTYSVALSRALGAEIGKSRGYNMIVENCKRLWQD